jgi:hypothetical protein
MAEYSGFCACRICRKNIVEAPLASMFDANGEFAKAFSILSGYDVSYKTSTNSKSFA